MSYVSLASHPYPEVTVVQSAATPLYDQKNGPISKGSLKTRVCFQGELGSDAFKVAANSRRFFPFWRHVPFRVICDKVQRKIRLNTQSLINRFQLPKKVILQASKDRDLGRLIQLVEDRIAYRQGKLARLARETQRNIRLSAEINFLPHSIYIGQDGFIATDQKVLLGEGTYAKVKQSITSENQLIARRVMKTSCNSGRLLRIYETFNRKPGIISTLSMGVYANKYGKKKTVFFHPIYDGDLLSFLLALKQPISQEDLMSISYQLLQGLFEISQQGIHRDLNYRNVLLRKIEPGYEAVISDFDLFCFHDEPRRKLLNDIWSPPESWKGETELPEKIDVWAMGLILLFVFLASKECPEEELVCVIQGIRRFRLSEIAFSSYIENQVSLPSMRVLLQGMLQVQPAERWTAAESLAYLRQHFPKNL